MQTTVQASLDFQQRFPRVEPFRHKSLSISRQPEKFLLREVLEPDPGLAVFSAALITGSPAVITLWTIPGPGSTSAALLVGTPVVGPDVSRPIVQ